MTLLSWEPVAVTVPGSPSLQLEARRVVAAHGGESAGAVIAPPHPLYGGTFHNPVVICIADGLARAGIVPWAFNWRGTEGSEGSKTDSLEAAVADYLAAVSALADFGALAISGAQPPLYAAGYSFGAATALLAARQDPRIEGVILLAPPAGMLQSADLEAAPSRLLVIVGDDDEYAPIAAIEAKLAARTDAVLDVIPGADHFFHFGGMQDIAGRVAAHVQGW